MQIHHVDGNHENHSIDNLAVLCMDCHTETQIKGGFHRKLDAQQVVLYRNDWLDSVARKRKANNAAQRDASPIVYYKHYNFRSRLAAQWAVFLDCLGLPYYYQPDFGLQPNGAVPDFFLPDMDFDPEADRHRGVFLMVSSEYPSECMLEKAVDLRDRSGREVYLFYGPVLEEGLCWRGAELSAVVGKHVAPVWIEQCPFCGEVGFAPRPTGPEDQNLRVHAYCVEECTFAKKYNVMSWFLDCQTHLSVRAYRNHHSPMLDLAYDTAKSASFDDPNLASLTCGIGVAVRKLREQRVFSTPETIATIGEVAQTLRSDPACPAYEEPWYVAHLAHLRSSNRASCPCYSCEYERNKQQ
ncbi:hypothetical protein F183_A33720 [Bryobacterales bacterium F-183]|nr:hypothetical protein F183_A33720 [Bryobacterales bacterium F-183]